MSVRKLRSLDPAIDLAVGITSQPRLLARIYVLYDKFPTIRLHIRGAVDYIHGIATVHMLRHYKRGIPLPTISERKAKGALPTNSERHVTAGKLGYLGAPGR
jgi:hypothetical protein